MKNLSTENARANNLGETVTNIFVQGLYIRDKVGTRVLQTLHYAYEKVGAIN